MKAITHFLAIFFSAVAAYSSQVDYSQYVNPLIGSEGPIPGLAYGGGDIFVGGALPFGVVKVGIDTYEDNVTYNTLNGGYTPNGRVTAISMLHESGTGGFPKYGVVPQMPLTDVSPPVNLLDNTTYFQRRVGDEIAKLGYYKASLENGVTIELSAARHAGIMQYEFPPNGAKHVLVDISHYLPDEQGGASVQTFLGGEVRLDEDGQQYTGFGTWGGGWNRGAPFRVYFCGDFENKPDEARTFRGPNTDPMARYHVLSNEPYQNPIFGNSSEASGALNDRVGALFTWSESSAATVKSRIGVSFISAEKACQFRDDEILSWDLNDTVVAAIDEWNSDVFSKIQVPTDDSQNRTNLVLLYSSLYFMHLMPSDRTGENPLWVSDEPSWDDFYTAWDIFRCTTTLWHIIQPAYYEGMIRALIDIWRFEGYMPDGRSGNYNGMVQGGSNADNILADAYVRGLRGDINWTAGYLAMVKDAEVQPFTTFALPETTIGRKEGRGVLDDWKSLGYIPWRVGTMPVSRSVEYALNDFALSQVAKDLAPGDYQKYFNRSAQWQNIWAHEFTYLNFTGFLAPRLPDGTFNLTDYNPAVCGGCEVLDISYEGTPFEYSFTIPHDMETLIQFMGGPEAFESRLDYIFQPNTSEQDLGANGAGITSIMNIGNEPDFATPYEYHYLNKQAKSVQRSRQLANQYFHNEPYGIPGNSDAGALNSWLVWQLLGFYPVVTQPIFLIGSPWFSDINITVNSNSTLRVIANGLDNEGGSYYVRGVKINGQQWDKNWAEHDELMLTGGTVEFDMGSEMVFWETGAVPPSPGHLVL